MDAVNTLRSYRSDIDLETNNATVVELRMEMKKKEMEAAEMLHNYRGKPEAILSHQVKKIGKNSMNHTSGKDELGSAMASRGGGAADAFAPTSPTRLTMNAMNAKNDNGRSDNHVVTANKKVVNKTGEFDDFLQSLDAELIHSPGKKAPTPTPVPAPAPQSVQAQDEFETISAPTSTPPSETETGVEHETQPWTNPMEANKPPMSLDHDFFVMKPPSTPTIEDGVVNKAPQSLFDGFESISAPVSTAPPAPEVETAMNVGDDNNHVIELQSSSGSGSGGGSSSGKETNEWVDLAEPPEALTMEAETSVQVPPPPLPIIVSEVAHTVIQEPKQEAKEQQPEWMKSNASATFGLLTDELDAPSIGLYSSRTGNEVLDRVLQGMRIVATNALEKEIHNECVRIVDSPIEVSVSRDALFSAPPDRPAVVRNMVRIEIPVNACTSNGYNESDVNTAVQNALRRALPSLL